MDTGVRWSTNVVQRQNCTNKNMPSSTILMSMYLDCFCAPNSFTPSVIKQQLRSISLRTNGSKKCLQMCTLKISSVRRVLAGAFKLEKKIRWKVQVLSRQMVRKKKNHCHWLATSYQIAKYSSRCVGLCATVRPASGGHVKRETLSLFWSQLDIFDEGGF